MRISRILLLFVFLLCVFSKATAQYNKVFESDEFKVRYTMENGKLHGPYKSFYKNGQKKAQGVIENNIRYGKWTLWDSTGNKVLERDYTSPFVYKTLETEGSENPFPENSRSVYSPELNNEDSSGYYTMEKENVLWHKSIWRRLEKKENPVFFEDDFLFDIILKMVNDSLITPYKSRDDGHFGGKKAEIEIPYKKRAGINALQDQRAVRI